jgi:hypothetical protein
METFWSSTCIMIQASNEILPNMKVEDLVLPFPKSPRTLNSHVWLASYDRIDFRKSWTSKGHISQTVWPILMGFFPTSHIWSPLSKNINFMSQNFTNQNGIFWLFSFKCKFDQELTFWYKHFSNIWPIGTAQKCHLECVCKLIFFSTCGHCLVAWIVRKVQLHHAIHTCILAMPCTHQNRVFRGHSLSFRASFAA